MLEGSDVPHGGANLEALRALIVSQGKERSGLAVSTAATSGSTTVLTLSLANLIEFLATTRTIRGSGGLMCTGTVRSQVGVVDSGDCMSLV